MGSAAYFLNQDIREGLAQFEIHLQSLNRSDLPQTTATSDNDLAAYIAPHRHLTSLQLVDCLNAGNLTAAVILDTCVYLRHLDLGGRVTMSSKSIQAIVCKPNTWCLYYLSQENRAMILV